MIRYTVAAIATLCVLMSMLVVRAKQPPTAPPTFDLVVVWCLVSDRAICKKPEEAIPINARRFSSCLRTGVFGMIREKVDDRGVEWFAHVYCARSEDHWFLAPPPDSVARSPWN